MADHHQHQHRERAAARRRDRDRQHDVDDAGGEDAARVLLGEQTRAFKQGGAALEGARAKGIGFLYDEDEGQLREKDKAERQQARVRINAYNLSTRINSIPSSAAGSNSSDHSITTPTPINLRQPEDAIPDLPENREAREFLAKAPTKGLFMPLGKVSIFFPKGEGGDWIVDYVCARRSLVFVEWR